MAGYSYHMAEERAKQQARRSAHAGSGEDGSGVLERGPHMGETQGGDARLPRLPGSVGALTGVIPGMVDTHVHQWDPLRSPREASRRTRLYRAAPVFGKAIFRYAVTQKDRELVLDPRFVTRPYLPKHYQHDAAAVLLTTGVPVESVVHMQADWRTDEPMAAAAETRWVASLPFGVNGTPKLGAIVARGDPRSPFFSQLLDLHLDISDRVTGVRAMAANHPDPKVRSWADVDGLLAEPDFLRGFAALAERNLVFDAWVYSHQLRDVRTLAREYPETTIVLNHFGTPVGLFGPMGQSTGHTAAQRHELMRAWREDISAVAQCQNVVAKLSGLAFPLLGYGHQRSGNVGTQQTLTNMTGPLLEHMVSVFGPDRLMFGSNFPADKPNASMATIVGTELDVLEPYGEELLRKVFRDNARRVYRID
ncbi:putative TIM-barrel fold metal-dependent hydrolase [Williamsia limnetica]|uniref:Putative TIM-barrel fold metal-dependent hydrolase n=2 Tax=Williamsia limnetica TaxID=882452 RepID=A0A318RDE3_WILLI|nr:putative TIM-barrel fold metal-dependent hydrolase [Williamsia limnetica]